MTSLFAPVAAIPVITLRPYQREAVDAVYRHLREHEDNPCVVCPTGAGKAVILGQIATDAVQQWGGRVLVLAHVKELLEQAVDKLECLWPGMDVGIYSAGLARRDTRRRVTVAGIQSVYQKAELLGAFDLVIVDEAHMLPAEGDGMYRRFLAESRLQCPHQRVIGFTATPFRLQSGPICTPDGILNQICYEIGVRELIRDGYLSPLRSKAGRNKAHTDDLHVRAGEFVASEVESLMDQDLLVTSACREIIEQTGDRRSVLIFASGVKHGEHVAKVLEQLGGAECGFLDGQMPTLYRDRLIQRFRAGDLKYLCNVNVLTTGFDAPNVDCVVLLRPTMSPGLYYQMVGRGFRLHPGKTDCLVLDFGGNVLRHGPVDQIRIGDAKTKGTGEAPAKECPQCQALIATGYSRCPECGHEFPPPNRRTHDAEASADGVLSGQITLSEYKVHDVRYSVHVKRDAPEDAPRSMRVDYEIGFYKYQSEWVCFEHSGYARQKAEAWWRLRSQVPVPMTTDDAVALADAGVLAVPSAITVRHVAGEKFDRICDYQLGAIPEAPDLGDLTPAQRATPEPEYVPVPEDEIPF